MKVDWLESEQKEILRIREILVKYCLGDEQAVKLCEDFLYVAHVWDDLYDRDKERSPGDINLSFCKALGSIPGNPIYQGHVKEFAAMALIAAMTWQIANKFESGNADEKIGSFILRNSLLQIIYFVVLISGAFAGRETWGIDAGEMFFKEMFKGYHDKYLEFLSEMK